jgi:hypothetical protein
LRRRRFEPGSLRRRPGADIARRSDSDAIFECKEHADSRGDADGRVVLNPGAHEHPHGFDAALNRRLSHT